ncbi:MAG: glutamine--fructose-6-phosphate transaminase (isomerizing) [Candidatus Staskawiczbacteria bacterium]|nr:glutamine--fructose-6-phosphate transaminase (isomerizing) [Candidatus Staskawiczbacteria bacterium]
MCGIIAYLGGKQAFPVLINGLKKLEYRGYDSAGVCIEDNYQLTLVKKKGKVSELEKEFLNIYGVCSVRDSNLCEIKKELKEIKGNMGIAHTRWATHGEPNEINAHPHFDCKKEIVVAHNGIIENYTALKEILEKEGHIFISKTDTEVISHLIEKFYIGNLQEAVIKALKLIEGTFGLAVMSKREKKIVVARRGSPIVLGIGEGENIVASDAVAVLPYTRKVIYLNDNEMVVLSENNYEIKDLDGQKLEKTIEEIKWSAEEIEKKGYKHFMLKEIYEQPTAIENTLRGRIDKDLNIKLSIDINLNFIKRIIIVACGTSWHSALIGKYLIERLAEFPVEVDYASEFRYRNPIVGPEDLLLVVSQSGETADVLAALKEAKDKGAKTVGIVNVVGSTIAREVDSGIYLHAGPEIGVATTKAFSCQVTALLLFALFLAQQKGKKLEKSIFDELQSLPNKIEEVLKQSEKILLLAQKFKNSKNFLYLGRGLNFPVALEGALKLKEISYIHAEGYPAAEMKHGPIALVDSEMPVVFIATKDHTYSKILSNMEEVKARGGEIIAVVNETDNSILNLAKNIITVPVCSEELMPIINTIPLQILAYHIADLKGIDVDKPKNLAKSVTVE